MKEFKEWAIIELFGHQKIAGQVTNTAIGGSSLIRVDVPAVGDQEGFTKLYGAGAVYSITITDEPTAKAAVKAWQLEPMEKWSIADLLSQQPKQLNGSMADELDDFEEGDIPY
jgi:hypothetical protein